MDLREIIQYNPMKDKVELNLEILSLIPELLDLYKFRKANPLSNTTPDIESINFEFKMLWWVHHPASPGFKSGDNLNTLLDECRYRFAPAQWRRTLKFNDALEAYEKVMQNGNPIYSLLRAHIVGLTTAAKTVRKMTDSLAKYSNSLVVDIGDAESVSQLVSAQEILKQLLMDGDKLNQRIESFRKIEETYGKEEARAKEIRGKRPYKISMDPDNDIES